jgi:hypothetical protein
MSTPPRPHRPILGRRSGSDAVRRLLTVPLGLALVALALVAVPVFAQTGATSVVGGVVLHGADEAPIGGVEVALVTSDAGEATVLGESVSGGDGTFVFDAAPRDTEVEVVATYADATYRSGPFLVTADGNEDLEVLVYETTDDASDVRIASWVVWVDRDAGVTVQQDLQVENDSGMTWLGAEPDADGTRAVLTVPLHPGAEGLGFLGRFTECCATMRGTSYVHTSPLLPGRTMGTVRYSVETLEALEVPLTLPVESFTLMLPPGVELIDAGAAGGGPEPVEAGQIESRGTLYTVYGARDLAAGDVVRLGFRGLADGSTPAWWYAVSAGVGLLVVAGAVWWMLRRRRAMPAAASTTPVPASAAAPVSPMAASTAPAEASPAPAGPPLTGDGQLPADRRSIDQAQVAEGPSPTGDGRLPADRRSIDQDTTGPPADAADAAAAPDVPSVPAVTADHRTRPLPTEALVEELALLDLAVDRGFVTREVYEQLREARLAELLAQTSTTGAER